MKTSMELEFYLMCCPEDRAGALNYATPYCLSLFSPTVRDSVGLHINNVFQFTPTEILVGESKPSFLVFASSQKKYLQ